MDKKQVAKRMGELADRRWSRSYVQSKFDDELQDRLGTAILRVVQGLCCAREHKLFPAAEMAAALDALLDIAQAREVLSNLAAKLSREIQGIKDSMEMLERMMEREGGEP